MIAGIAGWIASQFTKVEYGQWNMGSGIWAANGEHSQFDGPIYDFTLRVIGN